MWFVYFIAQKGIEWFAKINVMSYFLSSFGSLNWNFLEDIIEKDKIKESLISPRSIRQSFIQGIVFPAFVMETNF